MERKLELMRLYNETARFYDRRYEDIQRQKHGWLLQYLPPQAGQVLDLGCGSGLLLECLIPRYKVVVGVDFSTRMLELARRRAPQAHLVLADAESLPFKGESFEAVVSTTLLQNTPDPRHTVDEVFRVLKRGGLAVFTSLKHKLPAVRMAELIRDSGLGVLDYGEIQKSEDSFCVATKPH